jgi:two-component system, chemotaxis family, sensor kinase CheA
MFSNLNLAKYRQLIIAIFLFLLIDVGVLIFNVYSTYELESDASKINLSGSQRALTQRMGKSLLNLQQEKSANLAVDDSIKELRNSAATFEANLQQLKTGGTDNAFFTTFGLNATAIGDALAQVEPVWAQYKALLKPIMASAPASLELKDITVASAESKSINEKLMTVSNAVVLQVQEAASIKAQSMRWIQITAIFLAAMNFVYILFKFLRQLGESDKVAESAQKETSDILNTVDEGLLLIDEHGKTGSQMSKAVHRLFGRTIEPGEDFRALVSRLVDSERADEIKIYIDLLYDPKVKPSLLSQLDPMKEVAILSDNHDKKQFLSFNLSQLRGDHSVVGLLVTVSDVTEKVLLQRELSSTQSEARTDVEDLLRVFEQEPATMQSFLATAKQKLSHLNEAMRTVGKSPTAYKTLINSTSILIHSIKGESALLSLTGVSRQAHAMENTLAGLLKKQDITGEDLIPVVYELSRVQEQVERIERLFKRITSSAVATAEPMKPVAASLASARVAPAPAITTPSQPAQAPVVAAPAPMNTQGKLPPSKLELTALDAAPVRPSVADVLKGESASLSPVTLLSTANVPPLEELARNLAKLTSTVASALGKNAQLSHDIQATMPSGLMLRVLREVLPQLVRNSVVHGIESVSERQEAGKPDMGQLTLSIRKHQNEMVEVSLSDDGRGITVEGVKARLIAMGVNVQGMSNSQILQQIFEAQFSTAEHVTEHAGRGVGLALVRESLEKAGAKLKVNTRPGLSTEFVIYFGVDA